MATRVSPNRLYQGGSGADFHFGGAVRGRYEHELVRQHIVTRTRSEHFLLLQVVHPFFIGGEEDVGRRTGFDLFRERRAGCERGLDGDAGLLVKAAPTSVTASVREEAANTTSGLLASAALAISEENTNAAAHSAAMNFRIRTPRLVIPCETPRC